MRSRFAAPCHATPPNASSCIPSKSLPEYRLKYQRPNKSYAGNLHFENIGNSFLLKFVNCFRQAHRANVCGLIGARQGQGEDQGLSELKKCSYSGRGSLDGHGYQLTLFTGAFSFQVCLPLSCGRMSIRLYAREVCMLVMLQCLLHDRPYQRMRNYTITDVGVMRKRLALLVLRLVLVADIGIQ